MMRKQQSMNLYKLIFPLYSSLETHVSNVPNRQVTKVYKNCKFVKFELSLFLMILWKQQSMNVFKLFLPLYSSLERHVFTVPYTQINNVQKLQIWKIWTKLVFDDIMMQKQHTVLTVLLIAWNTCFYHSRYANNQS